MLRFTLDECAYRVLPQVAPGRVLADSEWRTLRAAAEVLLVESPLDLSPDRVADNVERFLVEGRSKRAWRCRILLTVLEYLPLSVLHSRFSHMAPRARRELFETHIIGARGLWGLCSKVRYLVIMGAYGDESVPAKLGVWGPGVVRPERSNARSRSLPLVSNATVARAHASDSSA